MQSNQKHNQFVQRCIAMAHKIQIYTPQNDSLIEKSEMDQ